MFTGKTRVAVYGIGPNTGGETISLSFFFKTTKTNEMVLVHYGGILGGGGGVGARSKDIFMLTLKQGRPIVRFNNLEHVFVTPRKKFALNDGKWHQIVVSMPYKSCLYSELQMYVDGKKAKTKISKQKKDNNIFFITSGKLSLGGFGYSSDDFETNFPYIDNFIGKMDSFWLWSNPISRKSLRQASKRRFEKTVGYTCSDSKPMKYLNMLTSAKCHKKCSNNPSCWGYYLTDPVEKKYKCYLFLRGRPDIGQASEDSICSQVVN